MFALLPAPIGIQDLGAGFSYQASAAVPRPNGLSSPFGTIHLATYSFPRPVGTAVPAPADHRYASLDPSALDITLARPRDGEVREELKAGGGEFPTVVRELKGDSLLLPAPEPERARAPAPEIIDSATLPEDRIWPAPDAGKLSASGHPAMHASLYFAAVPTGNAPGAFDQPLTEPAALPEEALAPVGPDSQPPEVRQPEPVKQAKANTGGQTVAGKGEVTGRGKRPLSPSERLHLSAKARAKAEKCLANAVYFEARGEPVRGQIAVAQVVMNRVFSEFYPDNVCDVVYQNAGRHLACQFTFACDGIRDVVTEPEAWERAERIAKDTLDGKLWLADVGKATHYHAYWVRPSWIREMKKMYQLGVHTFYRPRRWGDGSTEPVWGDAKATAALAKTL